MERHKRTSASAHKNDLFGLPAPSSERRGPVKTGSEEARAWTGTKGTRPAQATGGRSDGKASVPSGLTWFAGIDDTAEDTPVRTYESYRQQHVLQTPSPAHGLRTETALGDSFGHNTEKEPVIMDAEQETEMETRMMEVKLQSLRSQLEMQRQTSAKLAKMCKENKEEYETCVQRMAAEAESQRIRAHVVEQELLKRIEALESAHHGKGAPKDKQEKSKYVSIHGFSSGNNRREAMRKEEYQEYLENDVARLKHKVADLTTKLSKANVKGVKAETQLEKARSEHRDAMNSMRQTQVELHDRIEDKDMLIQALRNESNTRIWGVDKIREQHRDLELDRARLQQECEQLRVAVTQHELDNAKLTEELQHVKHISKELESSNATLKARFEAEQKGACKELEDSIATLKAHLEAEKKRVQQVESCLVDARKGDNELLHENRLLSSRLATITFQYEELERAVKEMHSRFTEEEEREHKKMQMQHSENRSRIQTLESQLQASQVELKRTKTLLQAEVDTLKAKNSMIEETKASEQADSSRMRDALKTEIVLLHDQHRIELEERDRAHKIELEERDRAHRIELAEKDRGHKIELDERHRERERERLQENDQHRQQLENMKEDTRQMRADHEALLRKMQNAHEEGERKLRLAQEEISVARSEKELTAVRMSQVDGDHAVKMVGLQQEHHKRVDDLVAQVASRDARIHELNNEIRSLNEALQETKQHAVSVQAKSERHRQKAEDLQSKLSLEQESKTALQDASEAGRQRQQDLEAKLRLSEGQRSTLELSVLQMTKTISALSGQMNELEKRKNAESERASSLEVKLSLETDARLRAEELAVEAVRWKDERGQGSLETNEQTQSPQHEAGSEIMSLRKMVLHLESRIAEKSDSTEQREKEKLAVLQEQLSSYQEQAKQWEVLRHQLCTRVAQLEGTHIATSTRQQQDALKARKFEVLATQRAEENVTLQRRVLELEQSIEEQNLQADKLRKSLERVQEELRAKTLDGDAAKHARDMETQQMQKCQAELKVAQSRAAQAYAARDDLQQEKDRLARANAQLSDELSALRVKGGAHVSAGALDLSSRSLPSRKSLYGEEHDVPSFREITPASAYHASPLGNELSRMSDFSILPDTEIEGSRTRERRALGSKMDVARVQDEVQALSTLVQQLVHDQLGEHREEGRSNFGHGAITDSEERRR